MWKERMLARERESEEDAMEPESEPLRSRRRGSAEAAARKSEVGMMGCDAASDGCVGGCACGSRAVGWRVPAGAVEEAKGRGEGTGAV